MKTNLEKVAEEKESEIKLKDGVIKDLKKELKLNVEAAKTAENELSPYNSDISHSDEDDDFAKTHAKTGLAIYIAIQNMH